MIIYRILNRFLKRKLKNLYNDVKSFFKVNFLLCKILFENKNNTILMFEPNRWHGETFAGYINYFTELGFNIHFVADKSLKVENPFVRLKNKNLKIFYTRITPCLIRIFFNSAVISAYKKIFITSNLGQIKTDIIIVSKTVPQKYKHKLMFIEHDIGNYKKVGIKEDVKAGHGQIFSLIERKYDDDTIKMINPCSFGQVKFSDKTDSTAFFASLFPNFVFV